MQIEGLFSEHVLVYVQQGISFGTRRTYGAPVRGYESYCSKKKISASPDDLTPVTGANYLASLGIKDKLSSGTIRTYRSALSTWWRLNTLSDKPNPMMSVACEAVMKGIIKSKVVKETLARQSKPRSTEVTPELLQELGDLGARAHDPHSWMMWTAACTAVYGALRPGELLGSACRQQKSLRPNQITFVTKPTPSFLNVSRQGHGPPTKEGTNQPDRMIDHFRIDLGITKADKLGKNPPLEIAAAPAVHAMYEWITLRRGLDPPADTPLFCIPGESPLRMSQLLDWLADWIEASGRPRPSVFTGKAFRRGATSSAVAKGADSSDIAKQGRWKTEAMVETYSSSGAKASRAREFNRSMAPPSAASSSLGPR